VPGNCLFDQPGGVCLVAPLVELHPFVGFEIFVAQEEMRNLLTQYLR